MTNCQKNTNIYTNGIHYGQGNENNYAVFMQIHEKKWEKPVIVQVIENKIEKFAVFVDCQTLE